MKKELFIPILILALTIAFAVVSAMVFLNGGKSATLVRRKLRLGALLLTFNAMIWGAKAQDEDEVTCYLGYYPRSNPHYIGLRANTLTTKNYIIKGSVFRDEWYDDFFYTGNGFSAGIFYQHFFGIKNDMKHSITFLIDYSKISTSAKSNYYSETFATEALSYKDFSGVVLTADVKNEIHLLDFKTLYTYTLPVPISMSVGLELSYVINNNLTEKVTIDKNEEPNLKFVDNYLPLRFENDRQTAVLSDGEPFGSRDFLFGINAEIRYDIVTNTGIDIIPYFGFNTIITSITEKSDWTINSTYIGLAVRFKFLF